MVLRGWRLLQSPFLYKNQYKIQYMEEEISIEDLYPDMSKAEIRQLKELQEFFSNDKYEEGDDIQ